ncbi:uncharacterized protein DUF4919 [Flavobacterium cutihirudinis]|uniref:Uncharacterized protein DUF4919 n=1 Tax=Flavobacterium cutihirudinis TaxID=1265740 RepID=A0A3D9FSI2_9FLAO|nr:DUF4919 domain-containing protein [Flavobacterium cutihirudinis]RED23541.1 uncharacterized protein DUF4919 [Flavobacterium cutihirudinis]
MIRKIILLTVLLVSTHLFAQENSFSIPDYKSIEKEIKDKKSAFFYPNLMERLTKNDTLLTPDEFRHLYFGYVFQPKYNAFWRSPDEKKLREFYGKDKLETSDYDEIIKLAEHSLSEFPFDLSQLNYLAYIYHLKGDENAAKITSFKFHSIINAIFSSGDGKTCESGFYVLLVDHEYVLLKLFDVESESQALVGNCDYLSFEKGKYKVDGIYFNIEKMLENETKSFR